MHWLNSFWWWVEVHTGTVHESGPYYGFWSGFGSDIQEFAILTVLVGAVKAFNCHIPGCKKIAFHHYEMNGARLRLCKEHHPVLKDLSVEGVAEHHAERTKVAPKPAPTRKRAAPVV